MEFTGNDHPDYPPQRGKEGSSSAKHWITYLTSGSKAYLCSEQREITVYESPA